MEQDSASCDTDIKKGAFKNDKLGNLNRGTWLADANDCPNQCATFGFCATDEELSKCKCDKIADSELINGVGCITKSGKAKSTSKSLTFDVLNAKNCLGGCANF